MLETFCAAANIKMFMQQEACPDALKKLRPLVDSVLKQDTRGTLMAQFLPEICVEAVLTGDEAGDASQYRDLNERYYAALVDQQSAINVDIPDWTPGTRAMLKNRHIFRGLPYSNHRDGKAGGVIFFQPHGSKILVPGVIRQMFAVASSEYSRSNRLSHMLLAVQRFKPCPDSTPDPFFNYPDFGASIWSCETSQEYEIIPAVREFHHAIVQAWDENTYVLKSTATVSTILYAIVGIYSLRASRRVNTSPSCHDRDTFWRAAGTMHRWWAGSTPPVSGRDSESGIDDAMRRICVRLRAQIRSVLIGTYSSYKAS